jgi:hypothetical protein
LRPTLDRIAEAVDRIEIVETFLRPAQATVVLGAAAPTAPGTLVIAEIHINVNGTPGDAVALAQAFMQWAQRGFPGVD